MEAFIEKSALLEYFNNNNNQQPLHLLDIETETFSILFSDNFDTDELEDLEIEDNATLRIKVEIGFGHVEIDDSYNFEEIYHAEKCKQLSQIIETTLLKNDFFYQFPDYGMCPGGSYHYYTIIEEKNVDTIIDILNSFLKETYAFEEEFTEEYFRKNYLFGFILDKVRVINTNTQTRYIPILGKILKEVSSELRPISIVKSRVQQWSKQLFEVDNNYRNSSGILHKYDSKKNIVETTAFEHYVTLLDSLGLIAKVNNFVRCTKFGNLYLKLLDTQDNSKVTNYDCQLTKVFFMFWFLNNDADGLLTIIQAIKGDFDRLISILNDSPFIHLNTDVRLRNNIDTLLEYRLNEKLKYSTSTARLSIERRLSEMKREIIVNKRRQIVTIAPAKHFISPRLAWLMYWNLIQVENKKYQLTEFGSLLYNNLPKLPLSVHKDIIDRWLQNRLFRVLPIVNKITTIDFDKLNQEVQDQKLAQLLRELYEWQNDGALRLSYYTSYLYICFRCLFEGISVTFLMLNEKLKSGFSTENQTFYLKLSPRLNESYITITLH